ncbi:FAD-dependent oxidoreductase [Brevibacterium luteolum]|uniref:FAD-dependent oxidoreductase n=2 Tax=Brevibacterium luteolum TaxID=199591 RepID=A0A6G8L134_9MICO|nr:FAD-dependent oxidoreductase [Brevibacterium luteolum]
MPTRLPATGIDPSRPISFDLDGETITGVAGDTLASALIAAGRTRCGDSLYRSRPRGIFTDGTAEPNAYVETTIDGVTETMRQATIVELSPGITARTLTGLGRLMDPPAPGESADPGKRTIARYDKRSTFADVLIVGAGPAGLAAARAAARTGARVILAEQDFRLGGRALSSDETIEGQPAAAWIAGVRAELDTYDECRVLTRTAVVGAFDSNYVVAVESRRDHLDGAPAGMSRQRLWHITADQVVLATGALERPLVFAHNDRPGIMLASAAASWLHRFGILPGRQVTIATTNDSPYPLAFALAAAGAEVTVIDSRTNPAAEAVETTGVTVHRGCAVTESLSDCDDGHVTGLRFGAFDGTLVDAASQQETDCDLLLLAGGWTPTVHLHSQRRGDLHWDETLSGFVPSTPVRDQHLAGAVCGTYTTELCLTEGTAAGAAAAATTAWVREHGDPATASGTESATASGTGVTDSQRREACGEIRPVWLGAARLPGGDRADENVELDTCFLDLQRDESVRNAVRAINAGMRNVEHIKRYTSIATGAEQGRLSSVVTNGVIAQALGAGIGELGVTTFRAPYTPVSFAALAGRSHGELYDPARLTPTQFWALERGVVFEDVGQWKRARFFARDGEDMDAAVARECAAVRERVGFQDASTLGKIEIRGADAPEFLNRMYTNGFLKLAVGKGRYGLMCGPDGMVIDDGVSLRLAEDRYFMSTTTGNAAHILEHLEEYAQTEWPELDVTITSVTEQWATIAVAGPLSRKVIAKLFPDLDVSQDAFGFMEFRTADLQAPGGGEPVQARVCRITFSGELAFEINVPAWYGRAVAELVEAAGEEFGITPYGTETMHVLRAEKAFPIVGQDTDGTVSPHDLGMGWAVSTRKEFVGSRSFARAFNHGPNRKHLVALLPVDRELVLPEGAQIIAEDDAPAAEAIITSQGRADSKSPIPMLGQVTSSYMSQAIGRSFALALVKGGRDRIGQTVVASFGGRFAPAEVAETIVFDPENARRDGVEGVS